MDALKGKEDERGKHPGFESVEMAKLADWITGVEKSGKYWYVADLHGNAHTFMTYSAKFPPFEFGSQVKKVIINKTQKFEDAQENTRAAMVYKMRTGGTFVFHMETMVPEMSKYDSKTLPLKDLIFKRDKMWADYKTIVKPNEDVDLSGNKGLFSMHSDFAMGVLFNMADPDTDDEILQMNLDALAEVADLNEFKFVYVLPEK